MQVYSHFDQSDSQSCKMSLVQIKVASTNHIVPPDLAEDAFRKIIAEGNPFSQ